MSFDPVFSERAAVTLAHSLWQGTLIAGCAIAIVRTLRLTSVSRYWILYVGLETTALCIPVTFLAYTPSDKQSLETRPPTDGPNDG